MNVYVIFLAVTVLLLIVSIVFNIRSFYRPNKIEHDLKGEDPELKTVMNELSECLDELEDMPLVKTAMKERKELDKS